MKILLLGSGELGKEVAIELKRYNAYVVAADRYEGAPAMSIADEWRVTDMANSKKLRALINEVRPDYIVPEIEAIATDVFQEISDNLDVKIVPKIVPSVKAVTLTMNREGIRRLAAEELGITTSEYRFASSLEELKDASVKIGFPLVIKPIQSSSGKGQSIVKEFDELETAWQKSQNEARGGGKGAQKIIVENFVDFDYEITLLTCKASNGTVFCDPIGHIQVDGDYRISWQTQEMTDLALYRAQNIAREITDALADGDADYGIFGVELFIKGDEVIFSEVSPRPHDTGMVTMISSDVSEFAMHARAILGLPVHKPQRIGTAAASCAILAKGQGVPEITNQAAALINQDTDLRIFGKPYVEGERRIAVALARGKTLEIAKFHAETVANIINVNLTTDKI